jgi:hypothetical protein
VSIYQRRDANERLKSSAAAFQRIEKELVKLKPEYRHAAHEFKKNLGAVETWLKDHSYATAPRQMPNRLLYVGTRSLGSSGKSFKPLAQL